MNMGNHIRAVVFDVDGTLLDTLPSLVLAANEVLRNAGLREVPLELMRPALSAGLGPMFRQALALQRAPLVPERAALLEEEFHAIYVRRWLRQARLFSGVSALLSALRGRGIPLGICTNRDRVTTAALLSNAGIDLCFDAIVGLGDAPEPKPAASPLLRVLQMLDAAPAETVFVGDSGMDARCADLSQVRFAAHLKGYAAGFCELEPNVLHFERYQHLTEWILDRIPGTQEDCRA